MLESPASTPLEASPSRLLLIASGSASASSVAQALQAAFGAAVHIASSLPAGQSELRAGVFDAILIEEAVPAEHPEDLETLYALAGGATILEVNFGLVNIPRVVRQLRRAHTQQVASEERHRVAARNTVQMELRGALAGLRLQSEIALRASGPELRFHLTTLVQLAQSIAWQVQIGAAAPLSAEDLHLTDEVRPASS